MHLGDLHLGKVVNGFSMIEDQVTILEQVKTYIKEYRPDAVLLAGDIYDRSVPPARAVSLYSQFLKDVLIQLKTPVLAIAGNHDGAEMLSFGHELFEAAHYYVAGKYSKEIKKVTFFDEAGPVHFYLLPFTDYPVVRETLHDKFIKSLEDGMRATLAANELNLKERNVLITHSYVSGSQSPIVSDSEKKLIIGGKEMVPASLFKAFEYVALGHLHRPQQVEAPNIRYSGSILKYSFSEETDKKSVTLVEMKADGKVNHLLLPLKPKRELRTIKGSLDELLMSDQSSECEDYIRVILTDEGELLEPMAKLRQVYPNIMSLEIERHLTEYFKSSGLASEERIQKTPSQLFKDFYEHHRGKALHEIGEKVVNDILSQLVRKEEA